MAGTIACPRCRCQLHMPVQVVGRRVKCPQCKTIFRAEANGSVRRAGFGVGPGRVRITVRCPNPACRRLFTIGEQHAGSRGPCAHCGTMMRVPFLPKPHSRPRPSQEENDVEIVEEGDVEIVEESAFADQDDYEVIEETDDVVEIEELESAEQDRPSESRQQSRSHDEDGSPSSRERPRRRDDNDDEQDEEEDQEQQRKKKKGKFKRRRKPWRPGWFSYVAMVWFAVSLIGIMPLPGDARIIFLIKIYTPIITGVLLMLAGGTGFAIVAINEEGWVGFILLWIFGPWYQLKLMLTHWAYVKVPFLLEVMGVVVMVSGILCAFLYAAIFDPH